MFWQAISRKRLMLWQLLFILLSTSWLWAPHLNSGLSYRTSLISQYESSGQPYAWLFRLSDVLAAILLLLAAYRFSKLQPNKRVTLLLLIIGLGLLVDPLLTTTCHDIASSCKEYFSFNFAVHAVETVVTSLAIFSLSVYDAGLRKKMVSVFFVLFQVVYAILFISQLASQNHFNTLSQYAYQTVIVVWIAWFVRDFVNERNYGTKPGEPKTVRLIVAAWAFLNGIGAILISLAHLHLLGKIRGLYFAGDSAWLAQHGVIIGVVMLYLSRHLARGELRARQIFLVISGLEVLKYCVVSPNPTLMFIYLMTFCVLFALRDDFDRGVVPLTWQIRLRDMYFMVSGLLLAVLAALLLLDRDSRVSVITARSLGNLSDYVARSNPVPSMRLRSVLLAHTISVFISFSLGALLWILFRPYKLAKLSGHDYRRVEQLLRQYSDSSEDYFKLWPRDKDYFWSPDRSGFIAYKVVGPVAFALADPISEHKDRLLKEAVTWLRGRRLTVCFLPVSKAGLPMYKAAGLETLQIGSNALIDVRKFLDTTINEKWWRWQKNRAQKNNYVFGSSSPPHSPELMRQLEAVSDAWLTIPGRSEQSFALGYFDVDYLNRCVIDFLRDGQRQVVAFANHLPQFKSSPLATVDLLRHLPEANNAMPYLIYKIIEAAAREKAITTFDLGFVPFAKAKGPILAIAKTLSVNRFSAKGLEQFKNKFDPDWQPSYLAYDGDLGDLAQVALNLEQAMKRQ